MFEPDRSDTRTGKRRRRHVDHWRPIHQQTEVEVWNSLRRYGVIPAPAYRLGWSRLSCLGCIFGSADQWASLRFIAPERFARIAAYERRFDRTIQRHRDVVALADRGRPYAALVAQPDLATRAMGAEWREAVRIDPAAWALPAGAFGDGAGPS